MHVTMDDADHIPLLPRAVYVPAARLFLRVTAHQVRFPSVTQQSALAVRLFPLQPNAQPVVVAARKSIFSAELRRPANNRERFSPPSNNNATAHAADQTTSVPLP